MTERKLIILLSVMGALEPKTKHKKSSGEYQKKKPRKLVDC